MNILNVIDMKLISAATRFNTVATIENPVDSIVNPDSTDGTVEQTDTVINTVDKLGNTGVVIVTRIGMFAAVICLICCGIGFAISNSQKREEAKERFVWGIIGAAVVFAATAIITLVQTISTNAI